MKFFPSLVCKSNQKAVKTLSISRMLCPMHITCVQEVMCVGFHAFRLESYIMRTPGTLENSNVIRYNLRIFAFSV